jgi:hypothetical protein
MILYLCLNFNDETTYRCVNAGPQKPAQAPRQPTTANAGPQDPTKLNAAQQQQGGFETVRPEP